MPSTLVIMSGITTAVIPLAVIGLRLYWQAVRDRRRQETLRVLAARLPAEGRVELDDVRDDGSRLRIRIGRPASDLAGENDARS